PNPHLGLPGGGFILTGNSSAIRSTLLPPLPWVQPLRMVACRPVGATSDADVVVDPIFNHADVPPPWMSAWQSTWHGPRNELSRFVAEKRCLTTLKVEEDHMKVADFFLVDPFIHPPTRDVEMVAKVREHSPCLDQIIALCMFPVDSSQP
ncbi:hypothetical protein GW17_00052063, partial [Ensete ventricosum]